MKSNIQKTVMRRAYYSYVLRLFAQPMLWQGFALGACVALFGRLTHVASIAHNIEQIPLANIPQFVFNAFTHALAGGEVLTALVALLIVILSAMSVVETVKVAKLVPATV